MRLFQAIRRLVTLPARRREEKRARERLMYARIRSIRERSREIEARRANLQPGQTFSTMPTFNPDVPLVAMLSHRDNTVFVTKPETFEGKGGQSGGGGATVDLNEVRSVISEVSQEHQASCEVCNETHADVPTSSTD